MARVAQPELFDNHPARVLLWKMIEQRRLDMADLSRQIGRNHAYIQQYLKRGVPRELSELSRHRLAEALGIKEQLLRRDVKDCDVGCDMTKYQPITDELCAKPASEWRATFQEIESILGFPLPASAREHAAWWANNAAGHPHSRAWLDAGWKTEQVDLEGKKVTFRKLRPAGRQTGEAGRPIPRRSLFGALKGMVRVLPGTDLTQPTGERWSAQDDPRRD